jgi:hypothetical protein
MAAIARMLSRASGTQVDIETLKTIVMFCGVGLTVSLLLATYGLDLSPGFFLGNFCHERNLAHNLRGSGGVY